jgi:hypothetical protein
VNAPENRIENAGEYSPPGNYTMQNSLTFAWPEKGPKYESGFVFGALSLFLTASPRR